MFDGGSVFGGLIRIGIAEMVLRNDHKAHAITLIQQNGRSGIV
jgi:hypothetical protein